MGYGGDAELVPHSEVWLRTHCRVLPDGTQKWSASWTRKVYLKYLELCVRDLEPDPKTWEAIKMPQWLEASGASKVDIQREAAHIVQIEVQNDMMQLQIAEQARHIEEEQNRTNAQLDSIKQA